MKHGYHRGWHTGRSELGMGLIFAVGELFRPRARPAPDPTALRTKADYRAAKEQLKASGFKDLEVTKRMMAYEREHPLRSALIDPPPRVIDPSVLRTKADYRAAKEQLKASGFKDLEVTKRMMAYERKHPFGSAFFR
jgi:hypothetical protein